MIKEAIEAIVSGGSIVVANYEDVLGNPWHSTLELYWDADKKDIRPGRMQAGISGHINT